MAKVDDALLEEMSMEKLLETMNRCQKQYAIRMSRLISNLPDEMIDCIISFLTLAERLSPGLLYFCKRWHTYLYRCTSLWDQVWNQCGFSKPFQFDNTTRKYLEDRIKYYLLHQQEKSYVRYDFENCWLRTTTNFFTHKNPSFTDMTYVITRDPKALDFEVSNGCGGCFDTNYVLIVDELKGVFFCKNSIAYFLFQIESEANDRFEGELRSYLSYDMTVRVCLPSNQDHQIELLRNNCLQKENIRILVREWLELSDRDIEKYTNKKTFESSNETAVDLPLNWFLWWLSQFTFGAIRPQLLLDRSYEKEDEDKKEEEYEDDE